MIICRTPFRLSFFGGGTDYPVWFREHGGAVLAASLDYYCYLTCRFMPQFFDFTHRVVWSQIDLTRTIDDIRHPVVRAVLKDLNLTTGLEIIHNADLPARTGLGSSSAFTVGLLHALHALQGRSPAKTQLAREAIRVEQELLQESVGVQDQITTAHGGLNRVDIATDGTYQLTPLALPPARLHALQDHLVLFYTGISRTASHIAQQQIAAIPNQQAVLHEMRAMVDQAQGILGGEGDLLDFGRLLHESWLLKRSISSQVATPFIDEIYQAGRQAGAVGGKLLGAGGGGFVCFMIAPERRQALLDALSHLMMVPVRFEAAGTQIIFRAPPHYSRSVMAGGRSFRHAQ